MIVVMTDKLRKTFPPYMSLPIGAAFRVNINKETREVIYSLYEEESDNVKYKMTLTENELKRFLSLITEQIFRRDLDPELKEISDKVY